ncbi:MAG: flagellar assembly protein FliW [Nocardioidaceae bacterium]
MSDQTPEPAAPRPHVPDLPVIELVQPMPGFDGERRFALVKLDDDGMLCALTCLDSDLRFLVVPPSPFFPDYAPEIDDDMAEQLELSAADDALVLVVLTAGESLASSTANLIAPVVINRVTRKAAQVVLAHQDLPLAAPLAG